MGIHLLTSKTGSRNPRPGRCQACRLDIGQAGRGTQKVLAMYGGGDCAMVKTTERVRRYRRVGSAGDPCYHERD